VLTPYLCVSPAAEAIEWYVRVLGAVEQIRYTGDDGRIGHAELTIGGARFMLSDEYPEVGVGVVSPTTLGGTPMSMHLEVPDVDAVYARVVADGAGRIGRPPHDEAYGARSFDVIDPFGHRWMIQTPIGDPTVAEIEEQMEGYTITARDDD
jgi:PhnB protein